MADVQSGYGIATEYESSSQMRIRILIIFLIAAAAALGQRAGRLIVAAEPKDHELPDLQLDDISVHVDSKPAWVTSWTPLTGDHAQLQLYVVIDDADSTRLSLQFGDLKRFIASQPASTQIGLAYLTYGTAEIAQPPTADHARAADALRLPLGESGIDASPYVALADLIGKWPPAEGRREMLVIMSGIDPYYQSPDLSDPYFTRAIEAAQKAGIVVSSISYASAGHFGHSFFRVTWGQNYLSMLDEELGGEFYWQGLSSPVSFQSSLTEFSDWLKHQYLLTVETESAGKPGLAPVRVMTAKRGVSMVTASKISLDEPFGLGPSGQADPPSLRGR
jgi:hypothetical protein